MHNFTQLFLYSVNHPFFGIKYHKTHKRVNEKPKHSRQFNHHMPFIWKFFPVCCEISNLLFFIEFLVALGNITMRPDRLLGLFNVYYLIRKPLKISQNLPRIIHNQPNPYGTVTQKTSFNLQNALMHKTLRIIEPLHPNKSFNDSKHYKQEISLNVVFGIFRGTLAINWNNWKHCEQTKYSEKHL